jgi:3-phosphoshikimate 1-carboxyvinyltransferase
VKRWRIRPGRALSGVARVPGDKSIGHRAVLFAALAEGDSVVRGLSEGLDNRATREAMRAMGAGFEDRDGVLHVRGVGLRGLRMAKEPIDCGNSGTTMRLLAGLLSPQPFGTRLVGDESLTKRPMRRIVEPLRARGAHIAGVSGPKEGEVYPPISIAPLLPEERLRGIEYDMPVASAQVKSALLLSGLYAAGPTILKEPTLSRDHTERMMVALGVPLETVGPMVCLDPRGWSGRWDGFACDVPGDLSSAAFLVAAAHVVPNSEIRVEACGVNPTRSGFLDALRPMGSAAWVEWKGVGAGDEPMGDLVVSHASLGGGRVGGELLTRMIDEVPVYAALAAVARGRTEIRDAKELRVKESDRLAAMSEVLGAFGVEHTEIEDGLLIDGSGGARLRGGARVASRGDHRIAMSAAILGLAADGETVVEDVSCVDTSFPGFAALLCGLGADIEEEGEG